MNHCLKCAARLNSETEGGFAREVCPECGWTHYNNPRPCVIAVIMRSEYILLTLRDIEPGRGKWDLPGGFIEVGEHPVDAIRREIREELSVDLKEIKLFGIYPSVYDSVEPVYTLDMCYLCQIEEDPQNLSSEIEEWNWFHLSDLPDEFAFISVMNTIKDVKNLFGF